MFHEEVYRLQMEVHINILRGTKTEKEEKLIESLDRTTSLGGVWRLVREETAEPQPQNVLASHELEHGWTHEETMENLLDHLTQKEDKQHTDAYSVKETTKDECGGPSDIHVNEILD